jgi:hypothetical protein
MGCVSQGGALALHAGAWPAGKHSKVVASIQKFHRTDYPEEAVTYLSLHILDQTPHTHTPREALYAYLYVVDDCWVLGFKEQLQQGTEAGDPKVSVLTLVTLASCMHATRSTTAGTPAARGVTASHISGPLPTAPKADPQAGAQAGTSFCQCSAPLISGKAAAE